MIRKILITYFEPFGNDSLNSSKEAVLKMKETTSLYELTKMELPVSFKSAPPMLIEKIESVDPDIIICVGQKGGASTIDVEKAAINYCDARIPDNEGYMPKGVTDPSTVYEGLFSTLPAERLVEKLNAKKIPAKMSFSAGTYVCNHVFFSLMRYLTRFPDSMGGFVHVPYIEEQLAGKPEGTGSLSLEKVCAGLELICRECALKFHN